MKLPMLAFSLNKSSGLDPVFVRTARTLFLADLGADVVRVDDPKRVDPAASAPPFFGPNGVSLTKQTDKDLGIAYLKRGRGKKSITIDLKSDDGLMLFKQLASKS